MAETFDTTVRFVFDFEDVVSSNLRLQPGRSGRFHNSPRYAAALDRLYLKARAQLDHPPRPTKGVPWSVLIRIRPPDNRRRDTTNFIKILLDALEDVIYKDDTMVHDLRIVREPAEGHERSCVLLHATPMRSQ